MNKKTFLRLLAQLCFGVDTIIAIGVYVTLSFLFQKQANFWYFVFAGFCAYLPDLDFTYFMFQSKEVRKWGHWRLGFHHPLLFVPFVAFLVWWGASVWFIHDQVFLVTLSVVCVLGHFIHDSTKMGFHWSSPISIDGGVTLNPLRWSHHKVTAYGIIRVPEEEIARVYAEIARSSASGGAGNEVATRIEPVTSQQVTWFALVLFGLIARILI